MTVFLAGIFGLVFGGLCAFIKYILLWRPISNGSRAASAKTVYPAIFISMSVDVVVLLAVFFLRNILPCPYIPFIIGTAVGLSLVYIIMALIDNHKQHSAAKKKQEGTE